MKTNFLLLTSLIICSFSAYCDSELEDLYGYYEGRLSIQELRKDFKKKVAFKTSDAISYNSLAGSFAHNGYEIGQAVKSASIDLSKGKLRSITEIDFNNIPSPRSYIERLRNGLEDVDSANLSNFNEVFRTKKMLLKTEFKDCKNADFSLDFPIYEEFGISEGYAKKNAIVMICDTPVVTLMNTKNKKIVSGPGIGGIDESDQGKKFLLDIYAYKVKAKLTIPNLVDKMMNKWDMSREEALSEVETMKKLDGQVVYHITDSIINSGIVAERFSADTSNQSIERQHDQAVESAASGVLEHVHSMLITDYFGFSLNDLSL